MSYLGREAAKAPIVTADLPNDGVTLAKMTGGTDGQIITYDASGDPVAVGPGTDGQVLTSTGAGSPPAFEDAAGGGVDGITSSADANAINIDSSERVIMKAQPMMLATGDAGSNQDLATSHADITILSATTTDCFIRGITLSSGVATVPIAGKYFISLQTQVSSISDGDTIFVNLAFSAHQDRNSILRDSNTSAHVSITGIFDMNASETVTAQISNGVGLRGTLLNSKDSLRMSMLYIGE